MQIPSGKLYCYYTSIFIVPASVEVTRETVAAVEMNMNGQNDENINIIRFYCVCVHIMIHIQFIIVKA